MAKSIIFNNMSTSRGRCKALITLALFMMLSVAMAGRASASAADETTIDKIVYMIFDDEAQVSGYDQKDPPEDITILSEVEYYNQKYPVTDIQDGAFVGCSSLKSVSIPASVTSIGNSAFFDCENLTSFTIPGTVTTLGSHIFSYSGIKELIIEDGENELTIPNEFSAHCSTIEKVSLPARVTKIGSSAFYNCTNLEKVTLPEGSLLTEIGEDAFIGCENLTSFTIPSSVTTLGRNIFNSSGIKYLTIEDGENELAIPIQFLTNCSKIEQVLIPARVTQIGSRAFTSCTNLEKVFFAEGSKLTEIGDGAFIMCQKLTSFTIPANVTIIGETTFGSCTNLSDVFCLSEDPVNITWVNANSDFKPERGTIIHVLKDADECELKNNINAKFKDGFTFNTYGPLTIWKYDEKTIAELRGDFNPDEYQALDIPEDIPVDKITFYRKFTEKVTATLMLPFGFNTEDYKISGTFNTVEKVGKDKNGVWTAELSDNITDIEAYKPYIFYPTDNITSMTFEGEITIYTPRPTHPKITLEEYEKGKWVLNGVDHKITWEEASENEYGFAGEETGEGDDLIKAGEFVRAGAGAWVDPMRCYLTYFGKNNPFATAKSSTLLPDRIRVVFPSKKDNEVVTPEEVVTPVSDITSAPAAKVWSYSRNIYIEAEAGIEYSIIDISGRLIKSSTTQTTHEEISINKSGVYVVVIGGKSYKVNVN